MKFKTQWTHRPVELTEEEQKTLDREIEYIEDDLEEACDLIFHTVMLTNTDEGPIIMIDGREGQTDTLFLTYYETPQWVKLQ